MTQSLAREMAPYKALANALIKGSMCDETAGGQVGTHLPVERLPFLLKTEA